jgi:16S rRNA (cytosine967-C5)-methyltransferase
MKPRVWSARSIAIAVLARVEATDAYLNVVLDSLLEEARFRDPRDAALATELCYGATRRRLALDACIQQFSERKLATLEDTVLSALRVGTYQLRYLRVPAHAAVSDTIEALKALRFERASGFVNAILRKVAALTEVPVAADVDAVGRLALEESHPRWLVERWVRQFGKVRAEQLVRADNESPALVIRVNTARVSRDELLQQFQSAGLQASATQFSEVGVMVPNPGRVEDLLGYTEGLWQVQDEAAQLVGLFAHVPATATVLDVCAAPGGKACHLAQTNNVTACDVHSNKLPKIQNEARRLGVDSRLSTRVLDASKPFPDELGDFDVVLIDAPCSGLGTLRRHPELRYRRKPEDIAELARLQRTILENAHKHVAPGGLLVFAVCSIDPTEGQDQVELFLRSHPDFTTESPSGLARWPQSQGHLRTLPGPEGLDGFFAARLRRLY